MKIPRFKYSLTPGCKVYHCGPASLGKIRGYDIPHEHPIRKKILYYLFVLCIWGAIAFSILTLYLALTLPNIEHITNSTRSPSITILDRNGRKITSINDMYGDTVNVETLPKHIWQAVIATEDKRFFSHFGVDIWGLFRAIYRNFRANRTAQGGSTITQQLAKNVFLSRERSIKRKLQEVMITLWLEHKFTKTQILSLYLNRVSLVGGKFGISIAAETIFGKPIGDINIAESAILAGMLRSPSRLNPAKNPDEAIARMHTVLDLMHDQKYITDIEYAEAMKYQYNPHDTNFTQMRYFIDYTMDNFNSIIGNINTDIIIHTTLDTKLQKTTENIAKTYLESDGDKYNFSQMAILILNTRGEILGMLGGADYGQSQFNRVHQMKRQPGSIFKPFVYLAALENGMHATDMFDDKLTAIADWMPRNHDNRYIGPVNMATALEKSLNTVPVQIAKRIGLKSIIATAQKLGLVDKLSNDYSIILGTSETTLMDLTSAYATFANSGRGVIPHAITKITTGNGTTIYERNGSGVGTLVSPNIADEMNQMLRNVILGGTGVNANISGELLYGKTGTSQNNRDAWFIGYTPKYITGIWIGNDDNSAMSDASYGGTIPAKIFKTIMTYIISNTEL